MLVARRRAELECCDGVVRALRDLVPAVKRQLQPLNTGHWLRVCVRLWVVGWWDGGSKGVLARGLSRASFHSSRKRCHKQSMIAHCTP